MFQESLRIWANQACAIFLSPWPILPGHALVVSNSKFRRMADLPSNNAAEMWKAVRTATAVLKQYSGCEAVNVNCKDGHPNYDRLTIHILPRKTGDLEDTDWIYPELETFHTKLGTEMQDLESLKKNTQEMKELVKQNLTPESSHEERQRVKRLTSILYSYVGTGFQGSQKQTGAGSAGTRTVEEELEKALNAAGMIHSENFGFLNKISWTRASRTDKGVSACINISGAKLLMNDRDHESDIRAHLPDDLQLISLKPVVGSFNAKNLISYREYEYLFPLECVFPSPAGYGEAEYERINALTKQMTGTKKFHNYTKNMTIHSKQANRYIMSFECKKEAEMCDDTPFLVFKICGQSFLYNQIRKMVGTVVKILQGFIKENVIEQSWQSDFLKLPMAPGEGLMLKNLYYDTYNRKHPKKSLELNSVEQSKLDEFRKTKIVMEVLYCKKVFEDWSMTDGLLSHPRVQELERAQAAKEAAELEAAQALKSTNDDS